MITSFRTQTSDDFDAMSELTGIDFDPKEGQARQEFKDETDINKILSRFGVPSFTRQPYFDDINFDVNLHQALEMIRYARRAYAELPDKVKEKWPTQEAFIIALDNGEVKTFLDASAEPPAPTQPPQP